MGIKLNTPAPIAIAQNTAITNFRVLVPHEMTQNDEMKIVRDGINIISTIVTYSTEGEGMEERTMVTPLSEVPTAGRDLLKQLYSWLEQEAQSNGYADDGIAEPL